MEMEPHDKYNIRGIAHVRTNRKDDIFMHHGAGHIPGIFSLHAAYSALRHFFCFDGIVLHDKILCNNVQLIIRKVWSQQD